MRYHTNEAIDITNCADPDHPQSDACREATDTKREQTKLRNRALADRKKAAGLVRVMVWVPNGCADEIRSVAAMLTGADID